MTRVSGDQNESLDAALRDWGRRPPAIPPETAARLVLSRFGRGSAFRFRFAFAAAAAILVAGAWVGVRGWVIPSPARSGVEDAPPPLPENVVQWWLDSETPVYFVTGPERSERGG